MSFDVWTPHKGLGLGKVRVKNTRIVKLFKKKKKIVWRDKSWIQSVLIQHDWSGHRPCDGAERSMNKDCHYSCMYMLRVCVHRHTCCFLTISSLVLKTGASSTTMPSAISFTFSSSSVLYLPSIMRHNTSLNQNSSVCFIFFCKDIVHWENNITEQQKTIILVREELFILR